MAVKKGTLKRKNGAGTYDEINLKTTAEQVKMTDGTTVQAFLDSLPSGGGAGGQRAKQAFVGPLGSYGCAWQLAFVRV